jgi:hypothetical protein
MEMAEGTPQKASTADDLTTTIAKIKGFCTKTGRYLIRDGTIELKVDDCLPPEVWYLVLEKGFIDNYFFLTEHKHFYGFKMKETIIDGVLFKNRIPDFLVSYVLDYSINSYAKLSMKFKDTFDYSVQQNERLMACLVMITRLKRVSKAFHQLVRYFVKKNSERLL